MWLDRLLRTALLVLVVALPWFFGGVAPLFRLFAAGVPAGALALVLFRRPTTVAWNSVRPQIVILLAACALGAAQLSGTVAALFDTTASGVSIRRDFAASPGQPAESIQSPISLHAPSTRRDLTALASAFAAFLLGAALFAETRPLILLLSVLTAVGAAT